MPGEPDPASSQVQVIDPDAFYTLYGDATEQQYDAASSSKLFLKLEREAFYALFGDFDTGLTVTELSRYSRSLNGLKTEYRGRNLDFNAFASETDQAFIRDEIRGDGTSGLYRLSRTPVVANSDKIAIEIRDRFHSEVIVSSWENAAIVLDGLDGSLVWKTTVGTTNGGDVWTARAINDLNRDGRQDVIAGSFDYHVYAFDGVTGVAFWAFDTGNRVFSVFPVGDLNGDGRPEVVAGTQDTTSNTVVHVLEGDAGIPVPNFYEVEAVRRP